MVPGNLFSRFYRLRFLGFPFSIKAWQKKIPERSEDDFLLADHPQGRLETNKGNCKYSLPFKNGKTVSCINKKMQTCSACIFHSVYNDFLFLIFPEDFFRYLACQLQRPFEEFFLCKFSLFHPCQLRFPSRCECGIRYFHSPYRFIYVKSLSGGNDISSGVSYIFTVNQGLQYAGTGGDGFPARQCPCIRSVRHRYMRTRAGLSYVSGYSPSR